MIHLYYGDGKGKTTSAIGLAIRAAGNNIPVIFVQFMKSASAGELNSLEKLGIRILRGKESRHFFSQMTEKEKEETKKLSEEIFSRAISLVRDYLQHGEGESSPDCPRLLLVLDEVCAACHYRMLSPDDVMAAVRQLPEQVEVVLTGRNPPSLFLEAADYITEMKKIRHPYDKKITARKGVEF